MDIQILIQITMYPNRIYGYNLIFEIQNLYYFNIFNENFITFTNNTFYMNYSLSFY